MVWYSYLLKKFPKFVVIHTVRGFNVVIKAKIDVFLELSCFFYDPPDAANLTSCSSAFSKSSSNAWKFTYCWSMACNIFSNTFLMCEMSVILWKFEYSLTLAFFGIGMKTDLF